MKIHALQHTWGGQITELHAIAHDTYKDAPTWYFLATVQWPDGKTTRETEVPPHMLAKDSDNPTADDELTLALCHLDDYLNTEGRWLRTPRLTAHGELITWEPKAPQGQRKLAE